MNYLLIEGNAGPHPNFSKEKIASFLFKHLEQYGDPIDEISACLDYVFNPAKGGFIAIAYRGENELMGATIVNETGMSGYIPENILVYIAVDAQTRGMGVGKTLMEMAIKHAKGNMALHVEADNPAKHLYEKLGFTNKYLEMRFEK
ncbi:MAG: GNAT family N-acetyltransferase [Croceimicrobium sp.]